MVRVVGGILILGIRVSVLTAIAVSALLVGWYATRDWADMARNDINAFHEMILAHHPGPVDMQNPGFRETMTDAREAALSVAARATDRRGYQYALMRYANSYEDGQLGVAFSDAALEPLWQKTREHNWPGFVAELDGGEMIVSLSEVKELRVGDRVVSCDGRLIADLLREDVFAYSGRVNSTAHQERLSPQLFLAGDNPFKAPLRACEVRAEGTSSTRSVTLSWERIRRGAWLRKATPVKAQQRAARFGAEALDDDTVWIGLPSFKKSPQLQALLDKLVREQSELHQAPRLVLDLRGNTDGVSDNTRDVAKAIWGDAITATHRATKAQAVDWRVSAENIQHARRLAQQHRRSGNDENAAAWKALANEMSDARKLGEALYRQEFPPATPREPASASPLSGNVFVLTDRACASACLDFLGLVRGLPGVTQIGAEPVDHTRYLDPKRTLAPSKASAFLIPLKVQRGHARSEDNRYAPSIAYASPDWSTEAVQAWAMSIEPPAN